MKNAAAIIDTRKSPGAQLAPVPLGAVQLRDEFWAPRRQINARVTLPSQFATCEETGRLDNMRRAAAGNGGAESGLAADSDVYKWLEAACWQLASGDDETLRALVEIVAGEIEAMQWSDGYLHSFYDQPGAPPRYSKLKDTHELYCFGHFMQAAVAHHRATASTRLLDVAVKLANHVVETFGDGKNQRRETDGHEEIELGLLELFRETRDENYLKQAQFFIDLRGQGTLDFSAYHQDDVPLRQMRSVNGHAVRALYYLAGATDLQAEIGDEKLEDALQRLWENVTQRRMYVSGGVGSRHEGETFGNDYELPNERAYAESCAAISMAMWAFRMLQVEARCEYADALERALYNGVLCGLALGGDEYFYVNPLQNDGTHRREKWFATACCPPNLARVLAQLPGYVFGTNHAEKSDALWVHLYAAGEMEIALPSGAVAKMVIETKYPFDGKVRFTLQNDGEYSLHLRIPAWCENARVAVRRIGETPREYSPPSGEYFEIAEKWRTGDAVELSLPMLPRAVKSHPHVLENAGRIAVMRGPLLYCAESCDNSGADLRDLEIDASALQAVEGEGVLRGVTLLRGVAKIIKRDESAPLYEVAITREKVAKRDFELSLLPYYAWANREAGAMQVWLREA